MRRFVRFLGIALLGACSSGGDDGGPNVVAVASVEISPNPAEIIVPAPGTLTLTATPKDASGNPLARTVTWSTTGGASVSPSTGSTTTLTATGPGSVTATSEGVNSSAVPVTLRTVNAPTVSAISPATLTPGATATITGTNFSSTPANNTVTVGGVAVAVTAATATQLTVQLPAASAFPCEASRNADVQVTAGGASGSRQHPLAVAHQRNLAVGQRLLFSTVSDVRCNELTQTGGRYVVAVYNGFVSNTGITAPPATAVELRGAQGIATQDPIPAVPTLANDVSSYFDPFAPPSEIAIRNALGEMAAARRADEKHIRLLEANTRILTQNMPALREQVIAARSKTRASPSASAAPSVPGTVRPAVNPTLGADNVIRVPDINSSSFCNTFIEITARTVYAGTRAIILADVANPDVGDMTLLWNSVGQEFDGDMFPVLLANFGNPLAMDPATDNDAKIVMVFSNAVNNFGGVAGFVVSCDFLPRTHVYQGGGGNNSSNFGEFFYAIVPTNANPNGAGSKSQWFTSMRSTIIHEVKHITSFAERIARMALSFELPAVEEGTARHAEELWARQAIYNQPWKGDITYANSLFCDVRPDGQAGGAHCVGSPFAVFRHFQTLYAFLNAPETFTPMGRVSNGDFNFYASMWSFVRWAIDNYAATEPAFLGGMTQSATLSGMPNIAARTGRPSDEMLGDWALSLFLDNYPGYTPAAGLKIGIPSWNVRDIFAGMNQDFCMTQQLFCRVFPLEPRQVTFGAAYTSGSIDVRGGSAAYFELSGAQAGKQLLHVRSPGGGDPAAVIRLAIARIQ